MDTEGEIINAEFTVKKSAARSPSIANLAGALAKAQGMMRGASKDAVNPHFKSKYADLASVWDAIREPLARNELAVLQFPRSTPDGIEVETMLTHSSGEWVSESLLLPTAKWDAHGIGSAITYARRYGLSAIAGVAPEDDDGNAAQAAQQKVNDAKDKARAALLATMTAAADKGTASYEAFWKSMTKEQRIAMGDEHPRLKQRAIDNDADSDITRE